MNLVRAMVLLGTVATAAPAGAERLHVTAGTGVGERGIVVAGAVDLGLGPVVLSARGERGWGLDRDGDRGYHAGAEATALAGGAGRIRGLAVALVAGARVADGGFSDRMRVYAVAAGRWHYRCDRGRHCPRDLVELALLHVVSGRDRPLLRHADVAPGWYLRVQRRIGIVLGAELGATGMATRDEDGRLRPEIYARAYLSIALPGGLR